MHKQNVIWSNTDICMDDWKEFLDDHPEAEDDTEKWLLIDEQLDLAFTDERMNLDRELPGEIICIADIGLWDGRRKGYRLMGHNLSNILDFFKDCEHASFACDAYNVVGKQSHHDGTHYLLYRMLKPELSELQQENFMDKLLTGNFTSHDVSRYTRSLRPYVAEVYGW